MFTFTPFLSYGFYLSSKGVYNNGMPTWYNIKMVSVRKMTEDVNTISSSLLNNKISMFVMLPPKVKNNIEIIFKSLISGVITDIQIP